MAPAATEAPMTQPQPTGPPASGAPNLPIDFPAVQFPSLDRTQIMQLLTQIPGVFNKVGAPFLRSHPSSCSASSNRSLLSSYYFIYPLSRLVVPDLHLLPTRDRAIDITLIVHTVPHVMSFEQAD